MCDIRLCMSVKGCVLDGVLLICQLERDAML